MRLDHHPYFRKVFIPWYDTDKVCYVVIFLMVLVVVFSVFGVMVSLEHHEFRQYIWLPSLLIILSLTVILSISIRLFNRFASQNPDN